MKHNWTITAIILASFFAAQIIGLLITNSYIDVEKTEETGKTTFVDLPLGIEPPPVKEQTSFAVIFVFVLVGTGIMLLIIRLHGILFWKALYFGAVFTTLTLAFGAFMPYLWAGVLGLALAVWKIMKPNIFVHNITELFIYGGLAAIFVPIINIFAGVMLLLLFSLYDAYAVWKSKHMITLAQFQAKSKVFAGLYIPYQLPRLVKGGAHVKKEIKKKVKTAMLGGGDIAFPIMFAGAVLKETGLLPSMIIPVFATLGLFALLIAGKEGRFYPAMPFLTGGCLAGYGVLMLIQFFF